jgi:cation transporter-like permease
MTVDQGNGRGGPPLDRSQSRFFCNRARTASLVCFILAFAALVIGGGFAEISTSGAPTALETAVVRWIILAALVVGFVSYYVGGRIRAGQTS